MGEAASALCKAGEAGQFFPVFKRTWKSRFFGCSLLILKGWPECFLNNTALVTASLVYNLLLGSGEPLRVVEHWRGTVRNCVCVCVWCMC